jgi:hypothetical protein
MIKVDSSALESIVRAAKETGSELISSKPALEKCLQISADWYTEALVYTTRGSQKLERTSARRFQVAVSDLLAQLNNDRLASFVSLFSNPTLLKKQLSDFSESTQRALDLKSDSEPSTGLESDFVDYLSYQDHFRARSPLEWLVGVYLIETYALNFRVKTGVKQKHYVPFAMAVLKALKIKNGTSNYSIESVRRAARSRHDRRKAKTVDDLQFTVDRHKRLYAASGRHWKRENMARAMRLLEGLE